MYRHIFSTPALILFSILTTLFQSVQAQQPEQDCINAIPVCSLVIVQPNSYNGEGLNPSEINPLISCLGSGEENSVWYEVNILTDGLLSFVLDPTFFLDDYDWAVYNLTNDPCSAIAINSRLEVSCNYSATAGPTGPNLPGGGNSQNAGGPNRNSPIPVLAGETYVINISNFSGTVSGFRLDFTNSTATIGNSQAPSLHSISRQGNTDTLSLNFNGTVNCNSLDKSDFEILVNNNIQVIDSIWSPNCSGANRITSNLKILLLNTLPLNSQVTVNLVDSLTNSCGNSSNTGSIQSNLPPSFQIQSNANSICEGDSVSLTTTLPDSGYSFLWSPGQTSTPQIVVGPLRTQRYFVQVFDLSTNLTQSDSIEIIVNPAPRISLGNDILICMDSTSLAVPAGPWASYQWEDGSTDSIRSISSAGNYSLEVVDQVGCVGIDSISIDKDALPFSSFSWIPDTLTVNFTDSISNADSISWNFGDGNFSNDRNPSHTYDSVGTYMVSLITTNRCGTDTLTQEVEVKGWALSLSEEILDQFLRIHPNPGSDLIQLEFLHSSFQGEPIQLYDMQGRLLRDYKQIQGMRLPIHRGKLAPGIYFIRIGNLSRKFWFE